MIEKIFENIYKNFDFIGGLIEIRKIKGEEIRASIDIYKWKIIFEIGEKLNWKEKFLKDILLHEIMHWKICPMDIFYHYELFELSFQYFRNPEDAGYVLNAFEDLIVNAYNRFKNPPYEGQIEFFKLQISKSFSPFYFFFVLLNLYLWEENKKIKELFSDFQNNKKYKEIIRDVKKLIKKWSIPEDKEKKIEYLNNPSNWAFLFNEFINFSKKYFKGEKIPFSPLSFFQDESFSSENKEKYIMLKAKNGEKPSFISSFLFYDIYYTNISPYIEVEINEKDGFEIPFLTYGKENFDLKAHSFYEINFKRPFFDKDSPFKNNINFYVEPFKKGIFIKKSIKNSFPDLLLVIDSSSSMTGPNRNGFLPWDIKYHHLLIGVYGVFKFLKLKRIAPYIKYSLINFSSKTISTGWVSYNEIKKIKEMLFSPQRGNTYLSIEKLEENLKENIFIIFVTDGEIHNWKKVRRRFIEIVKNYKSVLFQLEKGGYIYEDLKDKIPCFIIEKPTDIPKRIIDYTKRIYV